MRSAIESARPALRRVTDYTDHCFPTGEGVLAVLRAFFDESMRTEGDAPLCVGGYLFTPSRYKRFAERWAREVLRQGPVRFSHFHMTDLCAGRGEYDGLSIAARVQILERACDIIGHYARGGIAVSLDQAEFEREAPPDWPVFRGSVYSSACSLALQVTAHWLATQRLPLAVLYVFERGHRFQSEADDIMSAIAGDDPARALCRYRQHVFEDKRDEPALQAADLLVWTITKATIADGQTPRAFRPFLPEVTRLAHLTEGRCLVHRFSGDALRAYIRDQMHPTILALPVVFRQRSLLLVGGGENSLQLHQRCVFVTIGDRLCSCVFVTTTVDGRLIPPSVTHAERATVYGTSRRSAEMSQFQRSLTSNVTACNSAGPLVSVISRTFGDVRIEYLTSDRRVGGPPGDASPITKTTTNPTTANASMRRTNGPTSRVTGLGASDVATG